MALANTTLGGLMASINSTMLLIALPAIFNGIGFNPNQPSGIVYLIWLLTGYTVVTAVLLVTFGRLSDMFGRVRLYRLGFAIFTAASILLYLVSLFMRGNEGVLSLIIVRLFQGVGGGFLFANEAAILTDYFPLNERGKSLGINQIATIAGSFIGLIIGGIMASYDWHLVFLFNIPFGIAGTVWSYIALEDIGKIIRSKIDFIGNVLFAVGLTLILIGITYGLLPFGSSATGWSDPYVLIAIITGFILLALFVYAEYKIKKPMFDLTLFRIRNFASGNLANLLASLARTGLMLTMVIFLQGIWLPINGYSYSSTPFWAGVYMIPFMMGFIIFGPLSGYLSDKFGGRLFTTAGLSIAALGFFLLSFLPYNFAYIYLAGIMLMIGGGIGLFSAPNTADIMSSVPEERRGVAAGMRMTIMNSAGSASLALFFTIIISVMAVAFVMTSGTYISSSLVAAGISQNQSMQISQALSSSMPAPSTAIFSALLGSNPLTNLAQHLPASIPANLTATVSSVLSAPHFFANLVGSSFISGFRTVTYISTILLVIAALVSFSRRSERRQRLFEDGKAK